MNASTRLTIAVAMLALTGVAQAQTWPAKPVKIVVPYPPGGSVDVVTRKIAAKLQEQTGQTFFVENKAGATGTIGLSQVVQSPADGYTLAANDTTYALLPHIFKKLPFDHARDLAPVGAFVFAPMSVVVKADSKFRTFGDLVNAAKAEPNRVTYGTGGPGTTPHFVSDLTPLLSDADLWLHGHVHDSFDYSVAGCRVVANPAGYVLDRQRRFEAGGLTLENKMFDPGLVVELPA